MRYEKCELLSDFHTLLFYLEVRGGGGVRKGAESGERGVAINGNDEKEVVEDRPQWRRQRSDLLL